MKHIMLYIKVWAGRDSNPQYQLLANGYCPLLCDHQPTLTCFTLQRKCQVVPNRGTASDFLKKIAPARS